jgi:hypothetical protein
VTVGKTVLAASKVVARPRNRVAPDVHIPPLIDGLSFCRTPELSRAAKRRRLE